MTESCFDHVTGPADAATTRIGTSALGLAEPLVLRHHRLAQNGEVARVHGRMGALGLVLVVDRRQVEEALARHLEEMHGVDRLHHAQRPGAVRGLELGGLRLRVDAGDAEGERGCLLGGKAALVVGVGDARRKGAGKGLRFVGGGSGRGQ